MSINSRLVGNSVAGRVHIPVAFIAPPHSAIVSSVKDKLEKLYPSIEFSYYELSTIDDVNIFLSREGNAVGFLVFVLTSIPEFLRPITYSGKPTIIIAETYGGSGEYLLEYPRAKEQGYPVIGISTDDVTDDRVLSKVKLLETIARLKGSRVIFILGPDVKRYTDLEYPLSVDILSTFRSITALMGIIPVIMDVTEFREKYYDKVSMEDAMKITEDWIKNAEAVQDPLREEIVKSAKLYIALKNLAHDLNAAAVAVDCIVLYNSRYLDAWPCLAYMQLWYDNVIPVCEGDPYSAVVLLIGKYMLNKHGFLNDPGINEIKGEMVYYHCYAPTNPHGSTKPEVPYVITTAHLGAKHASIHVKLPINEPITVVGFDPEERILTIHRGRAIRTEFSQYACATKLIASANTTKIAEKFRWRLGWHRVVFYGEHAKEFEELATLLGLKVIHEDQ
jgi:hypothetical protein